VASVEATAGQAQAQVEEAQRIAGELAA